MSIVIPLFLSGLRLSTECPEIIFGSRAKNSNKYIFFTFCLTPILRLLLNLKLHIYHLMETLNLGDEEIYSKKSEIKFYLRSMEKLELGLETGFQFAGQLILFLLTMTETETIGKTEVQKLDINQTLLILSLTGSFIGCIFSSMTGISMNREHFPAMSKVVFLAFVKFAFLSKVLSIIMYFTPALGLFNVLQHWKYEQIPWNNEIIHSLHNPIDGTIKLQSGVIEWKHINSG